MGEGEAARVASEGEEKEKEVGQKTQQRAMRVRHGTHW